MLCSQFSIICHVWLNCNILFCFFSYSLCLSVFFIFSHYIFYFISCNFGMSKSWIFSFRCSYDNDILCVFPQSPLRAVMWYIGICRRFLFLILFRLLSPIFTDSFFGLNQFNRFLILSVSAMLSFKFFVNFLFYLLVYHFTIIFYPFL